MGLVSIGAWKRAGWVRQLIEPEKTGQKGNGVSEKERESKKANQRGSYAVFDQFSNCFKTS